MEKLVNLVKLLKTVIRTKIVNSLGEFPVLYTILAS